MSIVGVSVQSDHCDFNGRQYSLQGIYADAGLSLSIQTDESDIPDLAGPDSKYDLAELHSLMTSYRNSTPSGTGNDMSAYLVVVTNYAYYRVHICTLHQIPPSQSAENNRVVISGGDERNIPCLQQISLLDFI